MKANVIAEKLSCLHRTGKKSIALLLDPDHRISEEDFVRLIQTAALSNAGFFLVGGSSASHEQTKNCVALIKAQTTVIPTVLFPGNAIQVVGNADGILFMTLISGRNPDFLIGQQVVAAPFWLRAHWRCFLRVTFS